MRTLRLGKAKTNQPATLDDAHALALRITHEANIKLHKCRYVSDLRLNEKELNTILRSASIPTPATELGALAIRYGPQVERYKNELCERNYDIDQWIYERNNYHQLPDQAELTRMVERIQDLDIRINQAHDMKTLCRCVHVLMQYSEQNGLHMCMTPVEWVKEAKACYVEFCTHQRYIEDLLVYYQDADSPGHDYTSRETKLNERLLLPLCDMTAQQILSIFSKQDTPAKTMHHTVEMLKDDPEGPNLQDAIELHSLANEVDSMTRTLESIEDALEYEQLNGYPTTST
eukprot:3932984-Rhodomonas_salina.1